MISQQVIDYVNSQLRSGFTIDQVKQALIHQGWAESEVNEIINRVQSEIKQKEIQPEIQPKIKKNGNKLNGAGNLLTGILFILIGILIVVDIQTFALNAISTFLPSFDFSLGQVIIWIITVLLFIAGILNIISGLKLMK